MRSLLAIGVLVLLMAACGSDTWRYPTPERIGRSPINCTDCPLVDVIEVIDGDTIDTSIGRVRFYGIDAPERGEECAVLATTAARRLVGSEVRLEDGPRITDDGGRRLAYVFSPVGNSIDSQLVSGGHARAWTRDGQHRDRLVEYERSAKATRQGCLWANEPTPTAMPGLGDLKIYPRYPFPVVPFGPTAKCEDGSYSFYASPASACIHGGGVDTWYIDTWN
jgi:endonuclease YncB( thermonuclease family)